MEMGTVRIEWTTPQGRVYGADVPWHIHAYLIDLANEQKAQRQEERDKARREQARKDREQQFRNHYSSRPGFVPPNFEGIFEDFARAFMSDDPPPKTKPKGTKWARLLAMAEMPQDTDPVKVPEGKVYKKAQRLCHPDSGGSHTKWLNLQTLAREMGIIP